ncbi:MAG: hotdog domain-containing protein [Lentimicrobiaceae bacterium]|jgi:acyl-CoA hydrolase
MLLSEHMQNTETHQFRMVFHNLVNDSGNLFGGFAMQWLDEAAYITAIWFTRMKVVTVSVDKLKFKKAIKPGPMVEIIGKAIKVGKVKIDIKVEIFVEKSDSGLREKAVEANFTFAVIND